MSDETTEAKVDRICTGLAETNSRIARLEGKVTLIEKSRELQAKADLDAHSVIASKLDIVIDHAKQARDMSIQAVASANKVGERLTKHETDEFKRDDEKTQRQIDWQRDTIKASRATMGVVATGVLMLLIKEVFFS